MDLIDNPVWGRFWYPIALESSLRDKPLRRTLLKRPLVVWRGQDGPVVAIDRCPHRDAPLSGGWLTDGCITCPYHGWQFGADGNLELMPQSPAIGALSSRYKIEVLPARTAYGCVWTTLGDPLLDIPELREPGDGWRLIPEFDEEWDTHPARLMENSFDPAHTVFVHAATFGDTQNPVVEPPRVSHTDYGFIASNDLSVRNSDTFISRSTGDVTVRHTATHFFAPFLRVMAATYPSGVTHAIHTAATPVDANRLRLVQWVLRNDTEKDAPAADLVAFDRRVTIEDKNLLESIWTPYSSSVNANVHMAADRAQIALRRLWTDIETGAWPVATATNLVTAQFGN